MHQRFLLLSFVLLYSFTTPGDTGTTVLQKMYKRYHHHWAKTIKFIQDTEKYQNDSLVKKETWYETIVYPDLFRIDFGEPKNGNGVIFRNDSAWFFKNDTLTSVRRDHNDLIYLLGGMYSVQSFDEMPKRLQAMHYDPEKMHVEQWKGRKTYVIGSNSPAEKSNSFWVDADNLYVVRFIKYEEGRKEEGILDKHVATGGGWLETEVTFYINDHLRQGEKYHDVIANDSIDRRIFSPADFGKYHWYK